MIKVRVESKLVWRKIPQQEFCVPEGTTAETLLEAIGWRDLQGHALIVINRRVCAPERLIAPGDVVTLLAVISGG